MAQFTPDRQPLLAHDTAASAGGLSETPVHYLKTVHKLFGTYQRAESAQQQQIFIMMIHAFMQDLCGYPPTSYRVTTAASGTAAVGSYPHVIPASYRANSTLFYFTASEHPYDVQDLWVKQAQVYLLDPPQDDVAAAYATTVVFTNFFVIDGASKDPTTGAWHLWSASDIPAAPMARIDLRTLGDETVLALMTSHVVQKRLQMIQYQVPSTGQGSDAHGSAACAVVMPAARLEGRGV